GRGRQVPDKAVSVRDPGCARLAISQSAVPARLEDARRRLAGVDVELGALEREQMTSDAHEERLVQLRADRDGIKQQLVDLEARWNKEKSLIESIRNVRAGLESRAVAKAEAPAAVGVGASGAALEGAAPTSCQETATTPA